MRTLDAIFSGYRWYRRLIGGEWVRALYLKNVQGGFDVWERAEEFVEYREREDRADTTFIDFEDYRPYAESHNTLARCTFSDISAMQGIADFAGYVDSGSDLFANGVFSDSQKPALPQNVTNDIAAAWMMKYHTGTNDSRSLTSYKMGVFPNGEI